MTILHPTDDDNITDGRIIQDEVTRNNGSHHHWRGRELFNAINQWSEQLPNQPKKTVGRPIKSLITGQVRYERKH